MPMSELYHYGRKGMKWGRHIFGASKPLRGKQLKEMQEYYDRSKNVKRATYSTINKHFKNGVIKRDTTLYRMNGTPDLIKNKRFYASATLEDRLNYRSAARHGGLWDKNGESVFDMKLKTIKDLKYADFDTVAKKINEIVPMSTNMKKVFEESNKFKYFMPRVRTYNFENNKNKFINFDEWQTRRALDVGNYLSKHYNKVMRTHMDDIISYFKDKGYSAMVDPEDYIHPEFNAPMIIFDSSDVEVVDTHEYKKHKKG